MSTASWLNWTPQDGPIFGKNPGPIPSIPSKPASDGFDRTPPGLFQKIEAHSPVAPNGFNSRRGAERMFPYCPGCGSSYLYRKNNVGDYERLKCGLKDISEARARRVE